MVMVNIRDFAAAGDGETKDTKSIQTSETFAIIQENFVRMQITLTI
jgi:hypothetical protein